MNKINLKSAVTIIVGSVNLEKCACFFTLPTSAKNTPETESAKYPNVKADILKTADTGVRELKGVKEETTASTFTWNPLVSHVTKRTV